MCVCVSCGSRIEGGWVGAMHGRQLGALTPGCLSPHGGQMDWCQGGVCMFVCRHSVCARNTFWLFLKGWRRWALQTWTRVLEGSGGLAWGLVVALPTM